MSRNCLSKCEDRLKNILVTDKKENPNRIERVVKTEIFNVVRNYFEINLDDLNLCIGVRDDGKYDITINIVSRSIKMANTFDN